MHLLLVCLCFQFIIEANSEKAIMFDDNKLVSSKHKYYWIACAAFTEKEKQFNEKNSISGNAIFSRSLEEVEKSYSGRAAEKDLCENPYHPAILYDSQNDEYLIGYELYDKTGRRLCDYKSMIYGALQSVNPKNYTLSKKPEDFSIAAKYIEGKHTKFRFHDDHSELIFCWLTALLIRTPAHDKKSIHLTYQSILEKELKGECNDYGSLDEELEFIFSEQNQAENLKDIPSLLSIPGNTRSLNVSCGQAFGCLEKYQIIPLWYFPTNSGRLASCVAMNFVPVWKSIANKQLKKVDQFIKFVASTFQEDGRYPSTYYKYEVKFIFGVSDIIKSRYEISSDEPREMYVTNTERTRMMAIPEIIYRIIQVRFPFGVEGGYESLIEELEWYTAAAVVIIHNTLNSGHFQRLCSGENELSGWDLIKNEDARTGVTYVCPLTKELGERLGISKILTNDTISPLHLDKAPVVVKRFSVEFEDLVCTLSNTFKFEM